MENKTVVNGYTLIVNGLYGRNRNYKMEVIELPDTPLDQPMTIEAVRAMAIEKALALKPKSELRLTVKRRDVTIEFRDGKVFSRSFMMLGDDKILDEKANLS